MDKTTCGIFLVCFFGGLIALGFVLVGIMDLYYYIAKKRRQKLYKTIFAEHPELKTLLSEYRRLRNESSETGKDIRVLKQIIDEYVEKNKYLPQYKRIDKQIDALKERYQELLDIQSEQRRLEDEAENAILEFWKNNYPDLNPKYYITWWNE